MTAFRRRTVFAAPLIISLATGCNGDAPTKTSNPPGPENPKVGAFLQAWEVRRIGAGACEAVAACPPETKCNPSEPRASECPPGTSGKTVIHVAELAANKCAIVPKGCLDPSCVTVPSPCPLPAGQNLPERFVEVWVVEKNKNGDGGCHAEEPEGTCPPGVDCNPPTPRKVACPPGVTDTEETRVALLKNKTCAVVSDGCNAPSCIGTATPCP